MASSARQDLTVGTGGREAARTGSVARNPPAGALPREKGLSYSRSDLGLQPCLPVIKMRVDSGQHLRNYISGVVFAPCRKSGESAWPPRVSLDCDSAAPIITPSSPAGPETPAALIKRR